MTTIYVVGPTVEDVESRIRRAITATFGKQTSDDAAKASKELKQPAYRVTVTVEEVEVK